MLFIMAILKNSLKNTMPSRKHFIDFLFHSHREELLAFAWQQAGSENAEDLVQEAYLRMMQHPNPEAIKNPRAFLYKITRNLGIDQHRRQATQARKFNTHYTECEADLEAAADQQLVPEEHLSAMQTLDRLDSLLMELPELTRYAFVLYRLEGFSHNEVAERLGISVRSSERRTAQAAHHILSSIGQSV